MTESSFGQGPATNRNNEPVIDPTANVFQLVEAAIKRQDDLRDAETERVRDRLKSEISHLHELIAIRSEIANIRANHARELREAEAARIDAIRAVDVAAVIQQAQAAETRATALAAQVTASAEAMRSQVAAAAAAAATALAAALDPVQKDIADLRRAQYEQAGSKAQVVETRSAAEDMAPLLALVEKLTTAQAEQRGGQAQVVESRASTGAIVGVTGGVVAVLGLIITVIVVLLSNSPS